MKTIKSLALALVCLITSSLSLYSDGSQAFITLPVRTGQVTITSEKGLYSLIRNRSNIKYSAKTKELVFENDFFENLKLGGVVAVAGGFLNYVGVKHIQDAHLYVEEEAKKRDGFGCIMGAALFYLFAGVIIFSDDEMRFSPEGIKIGKKGACISWSNIELSLTGEISDGRARAVLTLEQIIKTDGLEKKEKLLSLNEDRSRGGITFEEFLGIVKYYMETYSGKVFSDKASQS